jgi:hypothetical protein
LFATKVIEAHTGKLWVHASKMRPDRRSSEFFELDVCHVPICLLEHLPLLPKRTLIMFGRHSSNELIKDLSLILFIGSFELGLLAPIRILCCSIASRRWRCRLLSNVTGGMTLFSMLRIYSPGGLWNFPAAPAG